MSSPSSIWCRDSNARPLEHETSPITTRPGLPSDGMFVVVGDDDEEGFRAAFLVAQNKNT